jgi:hypothetical protein
MLIFEKEKIIELPNFVSPSHEAQSLDISTYGNRISIEQKP